MYDSTGNKKDAVLALALMALLIGSVFASTFTIAQFVYAQEAGDSAAESEDSSSPDEPVTSDSGSSDDSTSDSGEAESTGSTSSVSNQSNNSTSSTDESSSSMSSGSDDSSDSTEVPIEADVILEHAEIEINNPVEWTQTVVLSDQADVVAVELPADAEDVSVVAEGQTVDSSAVVDDIAAADVVATLDGVSEVLQDNADTVIVAIEESAATYDITYETPAPYTIENEEIFDDLYQKNVTVAHDSAFHYTDVLSYSSIPEDLVTRGTEFQLYWMVDEVKTEVTNDARFAVTLVDTDGNGIADQLQWNVPQLSEQQFVIEGIILATAAEHLDENRQFVEDVYSQIQYVDGVWTNEIPAGDFIRVKFEIPLNSTNDITILAKSSGDNASVEVYEVNDMVPIATFELVGPAQFYTVYLSSLSESQDTFDLRVVGSSISFDQIIDPTSIDPSTGPVGTRVTLSSTGNNGYNAGSSYRYCFASTASTICPAGSPSFVAVGSPNAQVPSGTTITVPTTGNSFVNVNNIANSGVFASMAFTVTTATLNLTPSSGVVGTSVTLSGSGYAPNTQYAYCFQSSGSAACPSGTTTTFNSNGGGSIASGVTITVPASGNSFVVVSQGTTGTNFIKSAAFTVTVANNAPAATAQSVTTAEDTPKIITLRGTDADGNSLTFSIVTNPTNGTLGSITPINTTAASVTYTPNSNFNGADSFTFRVNDGTVNSPAATVSITVTAVNDAPVANSQSTSTNEDTPKVIVLTGSDIDSASVTFSILVSPSHGSLGSITPTGSFSANVTYTPSTNYNGADSFTFKASDGSLDSNTANVTITINAANDVPIAVDDHYNTNEDTILTVPAPGVLGNDTDVDNLTLTAILVSSTSHGALSLNSNGSFSYTPDLNYNGADSFSYKVNDGTTDSNNVATASISIHSVNDAPVADDDKYSTSEDTPLFVQAPGVLQNDTDVDSFNITAVLVASTTDGTLTLYANGSFAYTPDLDFFGSDSFTYKANDGIADSNIATVTLTVNAVNDAPVAENDYYATNEDSTLNVSAVLGVLANDTDVDNASLIAILGNGTSHGSLSLNANGSFTYTPDTNYNGIDSFTYNASDGSVESNVATVTISVNSVNDAPIAQNGSVVTAEDTPAALVLNATDIDGDSLIYNITDGPAHGSLTGTAPNLTYTPDLNYNGPDAFNFTATDGSITSNEATVSISVNAVNDAPVAVDDSYITNEDILLNVSASGVVFNDTDIENDPLSAILVSGVSNGNLTLNSDGSFTYMPDLNFNGQDSFTYKVNDGTDDSSNVATVTITVNAVNDAPVAVDDTYATSEDTPLDVVAIGVLSNDTDVDNAVLSAVLVSGTTHGTLTLNANGSFSYTPNANYNGADSFTYKANDGDLDSDNIANVSITINAVNDAPVAANGSAITDEDMPKSLTLNATDIDGDGLTYSIIDGPFHGTISSGTGASRIYTPDPNYNGFDSFTFQAHDGSLGSNIANVTITINPVNDAPVAVEDSANTDEDVPVVIDVLNNDGDIDSLTLTPTVTSDPSHGTAEVNANGTITYTPNANYNGQDSFNYTASDGSLESNEVKVSITINPVNDAPVANNDTATTNEDTPAMIDVLANDTDIEDASLVATIVTPAAHGIAAVNPNGTVTYTPNANYFGPDSFQYKVNDGDLDSNNNATVSITVNSVNDAPVAINDDYSTDEDILLTVSGIGVLTNDTDIENDSLSAILVDDVNNGTLTLNANGSFTYMPDPDYNGVDSFTYKANDGSDDSNVATVTITVNAVNDAPVAQDGSATTDEDTPKLIVLNATDIDSVTLTYSIVSGPMNGTLGPVTGNQVTYTPDADYNGADSFTFKVNDSELDSIVANVTITINAVNDAPVAENDTYSTNEDITLIVPASIGVLANDTDIDSAGMTAVLVSTTSHGVLTLNANGSFTYVPDSNYYGGDSFTYKANDGELDSNVAIANITVFSVNDAPVAINDTAITAEDTQVEVSALVNDSDVDGDSLTITLVGTPLHGTATTNGTVVTYTPNLNYNGIDSVNYTISDGNGANATAFVNLTITPVNDAPVANNDEYSTDEDTPLTVVSPGILGNDTDVDGPTMAAILVSTTTHGTLSLDNNGGFTYSPAANYNGPDSFTYKANDGSLNSTVATVYLTINAVNDAPVAVNDTYTTNEDSQLNVPADGVLGNDTDIENDTLSAILVDDVDNGILTLNANGSFTYTPDANYNGIDSFTYKVNDGTDDSNNVATVNITVNSVNDAPVLDNIPSPKTATVGVQLTFTATATDIDLPPQTLTFSLEGAPAGASINPSTGVFTWTPSIAQGAQNHTFTVRVTDSLNGTDSQLVAINVPLRISAFYQPVDMGSTLNTVKAGSTVPLKFNLYLGSTTLTSTSYVKSFTTKTVTCDSGATVDAIEFTTTGSTGLRWDSTAGQFINNWKTPSKPGTCVDVTMTTIDGQTTVAHFKLK